MRKTNSKAFLQPSSQPSAMSPKQSKPHSMIQIYKMKVTNNNNSNASGYTQKASSQSTSIISKVISAKRNNANINQKNESSIAADKRQQNNNNSVQAVKAAHVLSPGSAVHRKNESTVVSRNNQQIGKNQSSGMVPDQLQQNDTINNILLNEQKLSFHLQRRTQPKQLSKQKSLQTFFNTTQKLSTLRNGLLPKPEINNQRDVVRRGSKFAQTYGYNSGNTDKSGVQAQQTQILKNNQTLTRIRSAFLNFNQTQPSLLMSKTNYESGNIQYKKKLIQSSPSVSSDDEPEGEGPLIKSHVRMASANQDLSVLSKGSKQPNGSFIESKMKNCLHSRNNNDSAIITFQTFQGHEEIKKTGTLTKIMSQPQLHKTFNITQRTNAVKSSFLYREENEGLPQTPINGKSPDVQMIKNQQSLMAKINHLNILKGDMKSLNLSPIVPQNLLKNQQSYQSAQTNSQDQTLDTTTRKIDMRKESLQSKNKLSTNNRSYLSLKKEVDPNKSIPLSNEPTTEKKLKAGFLNFKLKKVTKEGQNFQESERGPGGTKYLSTTTTEEHNNHKEQNISLRILKTNDSKHQEAQSKKQSDMIQQQFKKKQVPLLLNNQNLIKVTQILNNNHMNNTNRYNMNSTQENIDTPFDDIDQVQANPVQTPRAVPQFGSFVESANRTGLIKVSDDKTLKKHQSRKSSSSFEDDEMPDAKDFDEFDLSSVADDSREQLHQRVETQQIQKEEVIRHQQQNNKITTNNNILSNYNNAAQQLVHQTSRYVPYDDRNSLVNYDCSLLTHNTVRGENFQSPYSQFRPSKADVEQQKFNRDNSQIIPDSFISQFGGGDLDKTKVVFNKAQLLDIYDILQDTQEQDEEPPVANIIKDIQLNTSTKQLDTQRPSHQPQSSILNNYKDFLSQIQKEEEQTIESITTKIISSILYKEMKNDRERTKYLSTQILEVRKYYKQLFIENILNQESKNE